MTNIWEWLWNTETKYYDEEITRDTDWAGDESTEGLAVSGGRILEWLKNEINGKFGYVEMSQSPNANNFYSIYLFSTKEDRDLYHEDPEGYADRMTELVIPISTVQGDAYTALLRTSLPTDANLVVTENNLEIPLNFRGVKISQLGNENAGYAGTLVIQRSTDDGSTWTTVGTMANVLTSRDYTDATEEKINIGAYLLDGKQRIRVRAQYEFINDSNETKTIVSSNVMVGASVTKTSLKLLLNRNFETPIDAYDSNGAKNNFPLDYFVYGAVEKTLHIEIYGATSTEAINYTLSAADDSVTFSRSIADQGGYGHLTHGVRKVKAWMTCDDGLGNTITSNTLVNRFMVVDSTLSTASRLKPYLLLLDVSDTAENFVQKELCQYAVYSPALNDNGTITNTGDAISLAFLLTDYVEDYEATPANEYFRVENEALPATKYSLLTTVEIEAPEGVEEPKQYDAYFRVRRVVGDTSYDFIKESTGETFYPVTVDNTASFSPVNGATFLLNPKVRNNSESDPARVLNARNNNVEVESEWTNFGFINDGWLTAEDGQKVLRIMAGSSLKIKYNPWKLFLTTPNSSMTFEIDCSIKNVTNESDPVVFVGETTSSGFTGLRMNAMDGWVKSASYSSDNDCLFSWQEDKRTHIVVNVHHQIRPNLGDVVYPADKENLANGTIALARVMVNGDVVREIPFSTTSASEWCTTSEGYITIGNEGADIDIYSIRIYENKAVELTDILTRNYISTLPTASEKTKVRTENDILTSGRIDVEKVKKLGKNIMIWHGVLPYQYSQGSQEGWYEIYRYDSNGTYLPEYSGTICEKTKSLSIKGLGSTAKTYYDWNQQDDQSKVTATINVALNLFHESIVISEPYEGTIEEDDQVVYTGQVVDIYGGNLGKNFPVENKTKPYPYNNGFVTVPDGWFDGNGKYRGMGYCVAEGTSLAQKKVIKINYASSMQNHLIGACKTYNLLQKQIGLTSGLQEDTPMAVSAKMTEPFMYFSQAEGSPDIYFKGMGNYGAGKMDKVTWGYVKKLHPMFAMIEGADNNLPLCDFRVPFDDKVTYSADDEGWIYAGQQNYDFDAGLTDDNDVPVAELTEKWKDIHNFIYLHAPHIKYYNGTLANFKESSSGLDFTNKYWFTQGDEAFQLYRYDFVDEDWVNAGLPDSTGVYQVIDLRTDPMTKATYEDAVAAGIGSSYAELNTLFNSAVVAHGKKYINYFIKADWLQFNYAYVLHFLAGTDNSSKNTYYVIDPKAKTMAEDDEFSSWFLSAFGKEFDYNAIYQLELHGDDMDSIFKTNNNSHQTKPYYIDRMHPYENDDTTTEVLYEGMRNALFNFCEQAYEGSLELQNMMQKIMRGMTELVSETDVFYGQVPVKKSLWGFLHKYFFNVQYYFPKIAFAEQNRIRYEFPQMLGFISTGAGSRGITPISQALGSQVENELQYMNRRMIYMASYAAFGILGGNSTYEIGLNDVADSFAFVPALMPDGSPSNYVFDLTPHQYIYPTGYVGQTGVDPHVRVAAGSTYSFTLATNVMGSDTGMGIAGINYYSDLGSFKGKSIKGSLTINGKRLKRFLASGDEFRAKPVFDTTSIVTVSLANNLNMIDVDCSKLIRCTSITAGNMPINILSTPESSNLKNINAFAAQIELRNCPNLTTLAPRGTHVLTKVIIGENVGTNIEGFSAQVFIENLYSRQSTLANPLLQSIHVENVNWTDFPAAALKWFMDIPTCKFKGTIGIAEPSALTTAINFELKDKINKKFGNVDDITSDEYNGLLLTYKTSELTSATLKGNVYNDGGTQYQFSVGPKSQYNNTFTKIRYSVTNPKYTQCSINPITGLLTVSSLSDVQDSATVSAVITKYANGVYSTLTVSKEVDLWNRPALVGDYVYADGTYSSPSKDADEKTVIGVCFYVPPTNEDGSINETYFNKKDVQQRLMVSTKNISISSGSTTMSSHQWGAYPISGDETTTIQYSLYYTDTETGNRVSLPNINGQSIYDIAAISNIGSLGLNDTSYITGESFIDVETDEGIANDGFKPFTPSVAVGDGFAYLESAAQLTARTLTDDTSDWSGLASDQYKAGDVVNSGYAKTLKIIAHRNNILNNGIDVIGLPALTIPSASSDGSVTELQSLADSIVAIREWAANTHEDAYPNKWSQLYYPAASACYAYEPTSHLVLKEGEVLADKFKAHNWFLPTEGMLARLYWYTYGDSNGILANLPSTKFTKMSASYHWSSAEYSSHNSWLVGFDLGYMGYDNKCYSLVSRAVAAF